MRKLDILQERPYRLRQVYSLRHGEESSLLHVRVRSPVFIDVDWLAYSLGRDMVCYLGVEVRMDGVREARIERDVFTSLDGPWSASQDAGDEQKGKAETTIAMRVDEKTVGEERRTVPLI